MTVKENTRELYTVSFSVEGDDDSISYDSEAFFSLHDAIEFGEGKINAKSHVQIDFCEQEKSEEYPGLWDTIGESYVILESGKLGWIDWRNGDPDRDVIPYQS